MGEHADGWEPDLFEFVEAAVQAMPPAPPLPDNPRKVREDAGYTLQDLATMVGVSGQTIRNWEKGHRSQGKQWRRYCGLIHRLANPPGPSHASTETSPPRPPAPGSTASTAVSLPAQRAAQSFSPPDAALVTAPTSHPHPPATTYRTATLGPRPGSLAVLSSDRGALTVHLPDGRTATCPVATLEQLPDWAARAGFTSPRTTGTGTGIEPPLFALTAAATTELGLPDTCHGTDRQQAEHLLTRAGWNAADGPVTAWPLLRRGPASGIRLAILPWAGPGYPLQMDHPTDTARLLGRYSSLLLQPSGPPGHCGVRLMLATRPTLATFNTRDLSGRPPTEIPGQWWRAPHRFEHKHHPVVIALRTTLPFAAAASGRRLPTAPLVHCHFPRFDPTVEGVWRVDLRDFFPHEPRLPVPFTSDGQPPTGPGWYPTDAVHYAISHGCAPQPIEAWLSPQPSKPHLNPWYQRLRDAQITVISSLGLDSEVDPDPQRMLAALERLPQHGDAVNRALLAAIAATEADAVLAPAATDDPPWLPDAREALLVRAATAQHRRLHLTARATRLFPLAATYHWLLYSAPTADVFHITPRHRAEGQTQGLRLGARPGSVQPVGHARLQDYADLVASLTPGDPDTPDLLEALIPIG